MRKPPVNRKVTDAQIIEALKHGTKPGARMLGISPRTMQIRKRQIQERTGEDMTSPLLSGNPGRGANNLPVHGRIPYDITDGRIIIGGDFHYNAKPAPLMHRAFIRFIKKFKPEMVVLNGDVLDLSGISRHPPIGWTSVPTVDEEIEAAKPLLHEIEIAAGSARKVWPLGNHDRRFSDTLAASPKGREYGKLHGFSLHDHFPAWESCWDVWVNDGGDTVQITHRFKGGKHATYNNALHAGVTVVTNHLHCPAVRAISDARGIRYGVDTGCIADPYAIAFQYLENNVRDWRAAFCILSFEGGRLKPPELVEQWDEGSVIFRGEVIRV